MFLGIQDFDFCPNLIKFSPNLPNFTQICLKTFTRGEAASSASPAPTPLGGRVVIGKLPNKQISFELDKQLLWKVTLDNATNLPNISILN